MRTFRSFNHSACKTVLNLLEVIYLRLRKIVVVTVVKFRTRIVKVKNMVMVLTVLDSS